MVGIGVLFAAAAVVSGFFMSSYLRQSDYWGNEYQKTLEEKDNRNASKFASMGYRALGLLILFTALSILMFYLHLK